MPDDSPQDLAALRDYIAAHDSRCPTCGYRLAGLPDPRCTECGATPTIDILTRADQGFVLPGDGVFTRFWPTSMWFFAIAGLITAPTGLVVAVVCFFGAIADTRHALRLAAFALLAIALGFVPFIPFWIWRRRLKQRRLGQ